MYLKGILIKGNRGIRTCRGRYPWQNMYPKGILLNGKRGIRTPEAFKPDGFQDRSFKPLRHLSLLKVFYKSPLFFLNTSPLFFLHSRPFGSPKGTFDLRGHTPTCRKEGFTKDGNFLQKLPSEPLKKFLRNLRWRCGSRCLAARSA